MSAGMVYLRTVTLDGLEPLVNYFDATYVSDSHRHVQMPPQQGVWLTLCWCAGLQQRFHCHPAGACAAEMAKIAKKSKEKAMENPYMSAFTIAEDILHSKCIKQCYLLYA